MENTLAVHCFFFIYKSASCKLVFGTQEQETHPEGMVSSGVKSSCAPFIFHPFQRAN
jgi:hypothetical protein